MPFPFFSPISSFPFALQLQIPFGFIYLPLYLGRKQLLHVSLKPREVGVCSLTNLYLQPSFSTQAKIGRERRDAESAGKEAAWDLLAKGKDQPWSQNGGVCEGRKGNGQLAEMEGNEQGRQEAKMNSFKKASKNQALLDMINSALHKSETIPSCNFCDRRSQRPPPLLELHYLRHCAGT